MYQIMKPLSIVATSVGEAGYDELLTGDGG